MHNIDHEIGTVERTANKKIAELREQKQQIQTKARSMLDPTVTHAWAVLVSRKSGRVDYDSFFSTKELAEHQAQVMRNCDAIRDIDHRLY